jgi:hypothetical protein
MDKAHGVAPTHEIFQTPVKVKFQWEELPTPENYRYCPEGEKLGKTIKVWKVQTKKFPEVDPGLVSDPYGFDDSPDAEAIASGLNSKGPNSVTLGRHGNFFLWGFSAQPSDMTPDARNCFVNSICYIRKFDGQKPLVQKTGQSREWALVYAGYLKMIKDEKFIERLFPPDLRKRFGTDAAKYSNFYHENLEYLHCPSPDGMIVVDEDVKSLGLSNRKVELLDRCVAMLERGEKPDVAMRILKRYTNETCADAKDWRAWLEKNRSRLFFTDVGGFKFLAAPAPSPVAAPRAAVSF